MKQIFNHARTDKGIASTIKIHPPRIARPFGKYFESFRTRMKTGHARREQNRLARSLTGINYFRTREHTVGHVHPAVGAPGEAIEQFVTVLETKARLHNL